MPARTVIHVITGPKLTAEEVLLEVDSIRDHATADFQQFEAAGRLAHIQRMSELYEIFFVVMQGGLKTDVLDKMRAVLGDKVRKNTKEAAVFIRYTFAKLDDKQVHVAAVGLEYAMQKQVQPGNYIDWINSFKDRWEGIRAASAAEKAGKEPADKSKLWELGMDWARGAEAVETINLRDAWDEAEEARIYVATANGDDTAALKAMHLKPERVQAVLAIYATEVKERNKDKTATKRVLSDSELKVKRNYEAKLVYNKQLVTGKQPHLHLAVGNVPADKQTQIADYIARAWKDCDFGNKHMCVKPLSNTYGWLDYMTKEIGYADTDVLAVEHLSIPEICQRSI